MLACVLTLSSCTDRDPVSSKQPDVDTEVAAKRTGSSITLSAPVAGLSESRPKPPEKPPKEIGLQTFKVVIENVTTEDAPYHLAPGVYVVHTGGEPIFTEGEPAALGEGLEPLAEDGDPSVMAMKVGWFVFNTPEGSDMPGPLGPGDGMGPGNTYEFEFQAEPGNSLSFATMFVQSNDLFFAPGAMGIALFEDGSPIKGDITDQVMLWDAGTEVNQEPGTGADQPMNQSGPNTGEGRGRYRSLGGRRVRIPRDRQRHHRHHHPPEGHDG